MKKEYAVPQQGSSIIMVLSIITIITLCFTGLFYNTTRLLDIVHKREHYAQKIYATQGILNYAIAFVSTHYAVLQSHAAKNDIDVVVHFDHCPVGDTKEYTGKAFIVVQQAMAQIQAILYQDGREQFTLSCQIHQKNPGDATLVTSAWRIG